jgi:hypothetical protein
VWGHANQCPGVGLPAALGIGLWHGAQSRLAAILSDHNRSSLHSRAPPRLKQAMQHAELAGVELVLVLIVEHGQDISTFEA